MSILLANGMLLAGILGIYIGYVLPLITVIAVVAAIVGGVRGKAGWKFDL